jgi:hypothetical protein
VTGHAIGGFSWVLRFLPREQARGRVVRQKSAPHFTRGNKYMTVEEELVQMRSRLDGLERRCGWLRLERWFWRCGCLLTLVIVGYILMLESGQRVLPVIHCETVNCETVNCKAVVVNDADGKRRASLGTSGTNDANLSFWAADGKYLALIGANEGGGLVRCFDRVGKTNVWTGFYSDAGAGFHIQDAKDVHRAALILNPKGSFISLWDATGKVTFNMPP